MTSKKLAFIQIILVAIVTIILLATGHHSFGHWDHYTSGWGLAALIIGIVSLVLAIMQIIKGIGEGNTLGLIAGILGLLSLIPYVGLAALVLNILVVAISTSKSK